MPVTLAQTGQSLDLELGARLQVLAVSHLLRTDRNGCIEITTDGERMWVEAAR